MNIVEYGSFVPAISDSNLEKLNLLETEMLKLPQVGIPTIHTLHGGVYTRTIMVPAGVLAVGTFIKIPTTLIVYGEASVTIGNSVEPVSGYKVVPAMANRKQGLLAHSDTWVTMLFKTSATSIEEAEQEFTDDFSMLASRTGENVITITGV